MNSLISIDPGKHSIAWAYFSNAVLVDCGLIQSKNLVVLATKVDVQIIEYRNITPDLVVVEKPQAYQQKHWKGDPNDLIDLALAAGAATHALGCCEIEFVLPRTWKGQTPKKISNARTLKNLTDIERQVFKRMDVIPSLRHNVIDAIGIGMWKLRR